MLRIPQVILLFFTGRNEVVAKVTFFTRVCDSVNGGGSPGRQNPPGTGRETPLAGRTPPDQADTPPGPGRPPRPPDQADHPAPRTRQTPPLGSRLQNTVYEWPVRILLECILVILSHARKVTSIIVNVLIRKIKPIQPVSYEK